MKLRYFEQFRMPTNPFLDVEAGYDGDRVDEGTEGSGEEEKSEVDSGEDEVEVEDGESLDAQ